MKDKDDQARVAPLEAGAEGQDLPRPSTGVQSSPAPDSLALLARRAMRIYKGFELESGNGVVCSIPDSGIDTPPHRTWCASCQSRYRALHTLAIDLSLLAAGVQP